jgi:VWFA-related protein
MTMLKLLVGAVFGAAVVLAQAAPSNSRLVLLDVIVNNDKGVVRGLTKDDFVVEDKGKKQAITLFDVTEVGKAATGTPLPAGVASNRLSRRGEVQMTATAILYDKVNSPSTADQAFVRTQVLRVLAGLKDTDHIGFYALGFTLQVVHDFDEEAAPLVRAAKALLASTTAPDAMPTTDKALFKALSDALSPMQTLSNQAQVNITYPAFRSIGRHFGGIAGRKNLIWITSRFPLTYGNSVDRRKNDQDEVDAFRNNLTEAGIALYPVDPGGTGASFNQGESAPVSNEGSLIGAQRNAAGTSSFNNISNSLSGNQAMQLFAEATGGRSYRNANDIAPALKEVLAMSEYTYTLGFYPDEKTLDGRVHELKVTLAKKPATEKAKASHRKQYVAWSPQNSASAPARPTMGELLEEPLLARSVGLLGVANQDPMSPTKQVIDLRISAADLRFDPKEASFTSAFDVAIAVEGQKPLGMKAYAPVLTAEQIRGVLQQGLDTREAVEAGAGPGVLRIVILDKNTGAAGSIRLPFGAAK